MIDIIFVGQPDNAATIAGQPALVKGELPAGLCMHISRLVAHGRIDGQLPEAVMKMFPIRRESKFPAPSPKIMHLF